MNFRPESLPSFSIVIPTRNRCVLLKRTLEHLVELDYPATKIELLVVDDGSNDGTALILEGLNPPFPLRSLQCSHRGPAAARNQGLTQANNEIVLFLDDDILVPPQLLQEHAEAHRAAEDIVAFGPVRFHRPEKLDALSRWIADDHELTISRFEKGITLPWEAALEANSSVRREHVLRLGGFDDEFYLLWENKEIGIRLAQAGLDFRYVPTATVDHCVVKGARDIFVHDAYWAGRSEVLLVRKHAGMKGYTSLLSAFFDGNWSVRQLKKLRWCFPRVWGQAAQLWANLGSGFDSDSTQRLGWRQMFVANYARGVRSIVSSLEELREIIYREVPVLFYHNVGPAVPGVPESMITPQDQFERQIRYLAAQGFQSVGLDDWLAWVEQGTPLPRHPVILNFDDAYEGVHKYALPVLRRYGMRASLFAVAGMLGETNRWDQARGWPGMRLMSVEQLREAAHTCAEIGSHSLTHADLSQLGRGRLEEEIRISRLVLEDSLGVPVRWFCYPYGFISEAAKQMVKSSGYFGAVSTIPAKADPRSDRYLLPRIMVNGAESLWSFRAKVHWASNPIETVLERWKSKIAAWVRPIVHAR